MIQLRLAAPIVVAIVLAGCASAQPQPTDPLPPPATSASVLAPLASSVGAPSAAASPTPTTISHPPVQPPLAGSPLASTQERGLVTVVVAGDGAVLIDGERVPNDAAIVAFAKRAHAKDPEVRARIDADTRVTYGRVVQVMDALLQGGIQRIAFGVARR